ncbi:uncharacterized protein LOC118430644 [Branchiostoma floridae]|uniref:Uncharacterized protein LOC118430644 n=1 Tax=Branchiostoma floridae TaxID=7739 RepID=A0A9J7NAV1_BRAFL|nr:uncharacterized protein LOC118430644 [Branchiostoma floridae]
MAAAGGVLVAEQRPTIPEPVLLTQVEVEEEPVPAPAEEKEEPTVEVPESAPAPEPPKTTEEERTAAEVISREVTKTLDFGLSQQRSVASQAVISRPILSRRAKRVQEVVGYKPPVEDPLETAILYVQEKGILYIFQTLLERLVFQKPPNPLQFLRKEIVALQEELQEYEKQRLKRVAAMKK